MSFNGIQEALEAEFCRKCGITVSWSGDIWLHDYPPSDDHDPVVPADPYVDDLL